MRKFGRSEDGAAAVEFAVIASVAIAAMLWFVDVAMAFQAKNTFVHAVNSVARDVYMDPDITDGEVRTRLEEELAGFVQNMTVAVDTELTTGVSYRTIEAEAVYRFKSPPFSDQSVTLRAEARAPILRYN